MLNQLKETFIVLMPKWDNALSQDKYSLVSLPNELYKIITRILVSRLKPLMRKLIALCNRHVYLGGQSQRIFFLLKISSINFIWILEFQGCVLKWILQRLRIVLVGNFLKLLSMLWSFRIMLFPWSWCVYVILIFQSWSMGKLLDIFEALVVSNWDVLSPLFSLLLLWIFLFFLLWCPNMHHQCWSLHLLLELVYLSLILCFWQEHSPCSS